MTYVYMYHVNIIKLEENMNKKIFGIILYFSLILTLIPVTFASLPLDNKVDDVQMSGEYYFSGVLIGRISHLHRFRSIEQITCQAINVKYKGVVLIRPPNVIDELEGQLLTGEIIIYRPYFGIVLRHVICAFVDADRHVFYS